LITDEKMETRERKREKERPWYKKKLPQLPSTEPW
jgi:hypothetical protein